MNLKNAYRNGTERLRTSGVPEPELDAWYLLEYVTGIGRASYYADPDREMTESRKADGDHRGRNIRRADHIFPQC